MLGDTSHREQQHRAENAIQAAALVPLHHRPQRVSIHEELLLEGGLAARCRAVTVVHDGLADDPDVESQQANRPSEVHVVVIGEEVVVEAACRLVGLARDGKTTAVGEERFCRRRELRPVRLAVVLLESAALEARGATHEVDATAVPTQHARRGTRVPRVQRLNQPPHGVRLNSHVVVEEQQDITASCGDALAIASRESPILGERNDPHLRERGREQFARVVC